MVVLYFTSLPAVIRHRRTLFQGVFIYTYILGKNMKPCVDSCILWNAVWKNWSKCLQNKSFCCWDLFISWLWGVESFLRNRKCLVSRIRMIQDPCGLRSDCCDWLNTTANKLQTFTLIRAGNFDFYQVYKQVCKPVALPVVCFTQCCSVHLGSDHVHTINKRLWSSFGAILRPASRVSVQVFNCRCESTRS